MSPADRRAAARRDEEIRRAEQPYREAMHAWANGDIDKAIEKLKDAVERARRLPTVSPANVAMHRRFSAEYHRALATRAALNNDHAAASAFARQARDADPENSGRADEFEEWLRRDREMAEKIRRDRGRHELLQAFEAGDLPEAMRQARAILQDDPRNWDAHGILTQSLVRQKRWTEAQSALVTQSYLRPGDVGVLTTLGSVALQLGAEDAAEALFSEAVLIAPDYSPARTELALARSSVVPVDRTKAREAAVRAERAARDAFRLQVRQKLEDIDVRNAPPLSTRDFHAGDVILLAPDGLGSRISAVADHLYTGRVFRGEFSGTVSHALTVVGRDARGRPLFLDNTPGSGPQVIGQLEFEQRYGARGTFVARPQMPLDGAQLMRYARDQVRKSQQQGIDTDYGLFGDDAVCSESAGFAIARASKDPAAVLANGRLGPIDITPADFLDPASTGKYFVVMRMERH